MKRELLFLDTISVSIKIVFMNDTFRHIIKDAYKITVHVILARAVAYMYFALVYM